MDTKIIKERNYQVVKANEIIQRAKHSLTLLEQKTFCYAVSKIKPTDTKDTVYTFGINEYCDVCGINRNDGRTIENVKSALKRLRDKSFYLTEADGSITLIGWLSEVTISPQKGSVAIKFSEKLQSYLIGLQTQFTQYSLISILPMRSAYSIRLYELLKSYSGLRKSSKKFEINDLKLRLNAPYERFPDFRRKALEIATEEINKYTDLEISWMPINKGRKVIEVEFMIKQKKGLKVLESAMLANDQLEGQMDITEFIK